MSAPLISSLDVIEEPDGRRVTVSAVFALRDGRLHIERVESDAFGFVAGRRLRAGVLRPAEARLFVDYATHHGRRWAR